MVTQKCIAQNPFLAMVMKAQRCKCCQTLRNLNASLISLKKKHAQTIIMYAVFIILPTLVVSNAAGFSIVNIYRILAAVSQFLINESIKLDVMAHGFETAASHQTRETLHKRRVCTSPHMSMQKHDNLKHSIKQWVWKTSRSSDAVYPEIIMSI